MLNVDDVTDMRQSLEAWCKKNIPKLDAEKENLSIISDDLFAKPDEINSAKADMVKEVRYFLFVLDYVGRHLSEVQHGC